MKIEINKSLNIESDDRNYILNYQTEGKRKKKEDSESWQSRYYGRIEAVLEAALEKTMKHSEVESIQDLLNLVKDTKKDINKLLESKGFVQFIESRPATKAQTLEAPIVVTLAKQKGKKRGRPAGSKNKVKR